MRREQHELVVKDLVAGYRGGAIAVAGVSLHVEERQFVTIGGLNGAGKTTLLRSIAGALRGDSIRVISGKILLRGRDISALPPWGRARLGIAVIPDNNKVFTTLSVEENLQVPVHMRDQQTEARLYVLSLIHDAFPVLYKRRRVPAAYLSGGERQMLAIAMALLQLPSLLLIDELTMGLSPIIAEELAAKLTELRKHMSITVILVDQFIDMFAPISDRWVIMRSGVIAGEGLGGAFDRDKAIALMYGW